MINKESWKENLVAITKDVQESGHNFDDGHVVFTWEHDECPGVTYTLMIGHPIVQESDEFDTDELVTVH